MLSIPYWLAVSLFKNDKMRISLTYYILISLKVKFKNTAYITEDSLVLIRMVQSFNSCVAFVAFQSVFTFVPSN